MTTDSSPPKADMAVEALQSMSPDRGGADMAIIVPAFGVADLLPDALRSLQAQTCPRWEAVIVDDGDADVAAAFAPFAGDARFRLLRTDNVGLAGARNRAVAASSAPVVALLDGDDAYQPGYVAAMLAALDGDASLGFVTCDARYFGLPDRAGALFSTFHAQAGAITLAAVLERRFNVFVGSAIRRDALEAVGGFDPALRRAEDFDLWLRLLAAGWKAERIAEPLVHYRRRLQSLSSNAEAMLEAEERVYAGLVGILADRPEQAIAMAMQSKRHMQRRHAQGERLILAGRAREGIAMLDEATDRSSRWRLAIPVMHYCPWLARPMMLMRPRLAPPRRQARG